MKRELLDQQATAAFQYNLETLLEFLELRHGNAQEFKSIRQPVTLRHPNTGEQIQTDRWADPPEKKQYFEQLRTTLREFVRPGSEDTARQLLEPIIEAYYSTSRAKNPVKAKVKDPVQD
jgi:hypothetical protein